MHDEPGRGQIAIQTMRAMSREPLDAGRNWTAVHSGASCRNHVTPPNSSTPSIIAMRIARSLRGFHWTGFWKTALPPRYVASTFVPRISSGGTRMMSWSSTTKSASFPGASDPTSFSMKPEYAAQMVIDLRASSRVMRCSGYQPPAGQPRASWRDTDAMNEISGLVRSTGRSLPLAMITPELSSERQA